MIFTEMFLLGYDRFISPNLLVAVWLGFGTNPNQSQPWLELVLLRLAWGIFVFWI